MNPDVDCYTKILHNRKILRKTQKMKRMLKLKYKLRGGPGFHLACSGLLSVTPLLFIQYKTTWLVRKRLCRHVEYVLIT